MKNESLFELGINENLFKLIHHLQKMALKNGHELTMEKALEYYLIKQLFENGKESFKSNQESDETKTSTSKRNHQPGSFGNESEKDLHENGNRRSSRNSSGAKPISIPQSY